MVKYKCQGKRVRVCACGPGFYGNGNFGPKKKMRNKIKEGKNERQKKDGKVEVE